jgi:tetratricopeptide (TPR) repeat protein
MRREGKKTEQLRDIKELQRKELIRDGSQTIHSPKSTTTTTTTTKAGLVTGLLCVAVAFVAYLNVLGAELAFDDHKAITNNADVDSSKTSLSELLGHDFWGQDITKPDSHKSFRPLTIATFRLNFWFRGLQPFYYHLVNNLLHAFITGLLFCYLLWWCSISNPSNTDKSTTNWLSLAVMGGLLFGVHPIHSEAVSGIVGRAELLCALFCLIGTLAYLRFLLPLTETPTETEQKNQQSAFRRVLASSFWLGLATLSCYAAVLSKETGLTVLGIYATHDVLLALQHRKRRGRETVGILSTLRGMMMRMLFLGGVAGGYMYLRWQITVDFVLNNYRRLENPIAFLEKGSLPRFLSTAFLHYKYSELLCFPWTLCPDWSFNQLPLVYSIQDPRNLQSLCFYSLLFGSSIFAFLQLCVGRSSSQFWAATILLSHAWLVIPFLPASNVFFPVGTLIGERLLYLPSVGFCILIALVFEWLRNPNTKKIIFTLFSILVLVFLLRCVGRNRDWQSEETLFEAAYQQCGNSAKVQHNVGILHRRRAEYDSSLHCFQRALEIDPHYCENHYQIAYTKLVRHNLGNNNKNNLGTKKQQKEEQVIKVPESDSQELEDILLGLRREGRKCIYTATESVRTLVAVYVALVRRNDFRVNPGLLLELGESLVLLGEFDSAIIFLQKAIASATPSPSFALGEDAKQMALSQESKQVLVTGYHQLVLAFIQEGKNQEGINSIFLAYQFFPEERLISNLMIDVLKRMLLSTPPNTFEQQLDRSKIANTLGVVLTQQEKFGEALEAFNESLRTLSLLLANNKSSPPLLSDVLVNTATVHYRLGSFGKAREWAQKALRANPLLETHPTLISILNHP